MSKVNLEIELQKQNDLIEAYKVAVKTSLTDGEACSKTVKMAAPRYYVTPKQAYQVICKMMRGDFELVDMMYDNRKRMYYSLFQRVVELSEKRAFVGKSLWYIMPYAVMEPAPEFFLSPLTVSRIRNGIMKGTIDDEGRHYTELTEKQIIFREKRAEERRRLKEYRLMRKKEKGEIV